MKLPNRSKARAACLVFVFIAASQILPGQPAGETGEGAGTAADARWRQLEQARQNRGDAAGTAEDLIVEADGFRTFRLQNPGHPEAANARRLEALSLLEAWQAGDNSQAARRSQLVAEVRRDSRLSVAERGEIGAHADHTAVEKTPGLLFADRIKAYEEVARGLAAEFPQWPTIYESLVGIARDSLPADGRQLAADVLAISAAPEWIKVQAEETQARFDLVGTPLAAHLRPSDQAELAKLGDKAPIVIYTWSAAQPWSLQMAGALAAHAMGEVGLLGICLDRDDPAAARAVGRDLPGQVIYDSGSEVGELAEALQLDRAGMVYLTDTSGIIRSVSGRPDLMVELGILDSSHLQR